MTQSAPLVTAPSENEVLAKIEMVADATTRNALLAIFFWRLGTRAVTEAVAQPRISISLKQEE